ncbi:MAG: plasminogen-binding N-terminal domain-containing protein [Sulfurimonas sp.]|nr:plasminogen-binding N-terminal domain-containing protein [Sulfurimonas sp.]
MKYIFLLLLALFELNAGVVKSPIVTLDSDENIATIKINKIDVGMSGFIVHEIAPDHTSILKNVVVKSYDKTTQIAILKMSDYTGLRNNALPTGNWSVVVGDTAVFAFGYSRALLIAPSEEIYHQVSKSIKIQWIHPDIFATILSFKGHPTPLKEDFEAMSDASSVGLVFIYLNKKLFMLDIKSFKILTINDAPLVQDSVKLPFYTRIEEIDANWWGEGSNELESYEPHYYELLVAFNKKDKNLYEIIKNGDEKLHYLLDDFEIGN